MIARLHSRFEKAIVVVLMGLLMLVVTYATLSLGFRIFRYFIAYAPSEFASIDRVSFLALIHDAYSAFLLILIGIELIQSIAVYLREHVLHVEVVLTVALIAVARHAIDVDYAAASPWSLMGVGVLTVALAGAYWLFRKSNSRHGGAADA